MARSWRALFPTVLAGAADAFRDFWADADEIDLTAPEDEPAGVVVWSDD